MMKKIVVISLGGSQIIKNNEVNVVFLKKFRDIVRKYSKSYKFVIVCGGGSVARIYINGLKDRDHKLQSFAGISVTRVNARFMSYFFGSDQLDGVPHDLKGVKKFLNKEGIVFCGGLKYQPNQTSDSTAAQIAEKLNAEFINITNVKGLYSSNPKTNKNAVFIPEISWKEFHKRANKLKFHPGQHFVLDQKASKIILDKKIKTYIIGDDLRNLDKLLSNKIFEGTIIQG